MFSRQLKAIPLAPEVRTLLDLDKPQATPFEVMTAILKARATCCGLAVSAPMSAPPRKATIRPATAPTIRSVSRAATSAPG